MGDGLVDPDAFLPGSKHLRPAAVRLSAGALRALGAAVASRTGAVASLWAGLGGCYQAPESEQVLALMGPAATAGQDMAAATGRAAAALEDYADELDPVRRDMLDLEGRARAFRDRVKGGVKTSVIGEVSGWEVVLSPAAALVGAATSGWVTVPWYQHGPSVEENDGLVAEYQRLYGRVGQAVSRCALAVDQVAYTMLVARSAVASVFSGPVEPPAWGYAREEDRNVVEQVFGAEGRWVENLASGGAALFGRDPAAGGVLDGWGSGRAARNAWCGLGNLLGSLAVVANPVLAPFAAAGAVEDRTGWDLPGGAVADWAGDRLRVVSDAGASLIAYDPAAAGAGGDGWHAWKDEPAGALTTSALNVGTFFVPVAGEAGAGAKAATTGARVGTWASRGARTAAEVVAPGMSWLVHGTELAARGAGALARTGQWSSALEAVRAAAGTGRAGAGGVTNGVVQALADLDKVPAPVHRLPEGVPSVSGSVRPTGGLPRPGGQAPGSWLYQEPPAGPGAAGRGAGLPVQAGRDLGPAGGGRSGEPGAAASGRPQSPEGPGRAGDAVTTQPIPGLPRPSRGPAAPADGLPGGTGPGSAGRGVAAGGRPEGQVSRPEGVPEESLPTWKDPGTVPGSRAPEAGAAWPPRPPDGLAPAGTPARPQTAAADTPPAVRAEGGAGRGTGAQVPEPGREPVGAAVGAQRTGRVASAAGRADSLGASASRADGLGASAWTGGPGGPHAPSGVPGRGSGADLPLGSGPGTGDGPGRGPSGPGGAGRSQTGGPSGPDGTGSARPADQTGPAADPHDPSGAGKDGTAGPGRGWDPDDPVVTTVPESQAPRRWTDADVAAAYDRAPVDEHGNHLDHRNGQPLDGPRTDGQRGWHMTWDPDHHQWVAENPGHAQHTMPPHGEPDTYGYDHDGNLLRYAEHRPAHSPTQADDVWQAAPKHHDDTGREYVEVRDADDNLVRIYTDQRDPRSKVWDMGHVKGQEYWKLKDRYMRGWISEEEFLREFRDPGNYEVQHWLRNQSHMDEAPRDPGGDVLGYDERPGEAGGGDG